MMTGFINWCLANENLLIGVFSYITFISLIVFTLILSFVTLFFHPLVGIPAFFGVWYLIYLQYKKENT